MATDVAPVTGDGAAGGQGGSPVGALLRTCRVKAGYDLDELSRQLRIRRLFLEAIEDGRFADLPGHTYAIGFVKAYAEYFGLDTQEIVRRFRNEVGETNGAHELHFPAPVAEGGTPRAAIVLIGLIIAGIAYGVWYFNSVHDNVIADLVSPVPERLRHLIYGKEGTGGEANHAAEAGAANSQEAPVVVVPVPPRTEAPAHGQSAEPAAPPPPAPAAAPAASPPAVMPSVATPSAASQSGSAAPAPVTPPATPPGTAAPQTDAASQAAVTPSPPAATAESAAPPEPAPPPAAPGVRIVLRATSDCWVQIRDPATRATLLARILKAGESFEVPDTAGLVMTVGNAGGLDVVVDGNVLPPLGKEGAVRRNVPLDADQLRQGLSGGN